MNPADADLGPCGSRCAGRLRPVLSDDGAAWEAERCDVCGHSWWYQVPRLPSEIEMDARLRALGVAS